MLFKMRQLLLLSFLIVCFVGSITALDPTLYEYYTSGGIHSGLEANGEQFKLNGKHIVIFSGSFHYFRVVPQHWRAILQRFKAAGLNAVQLYVAWNMHEDIPGHFDFESEWLNLANFLEEIKQADMFAIVRPGPFICAEWELGGYPSWLLRDPQMKFRTMQQHHLDRVKIYYEKVLQIINKHQFSTTGGPVIMMQLENEYAFSFKHADYHGPQYLNFLHDIAIKSGFKQLLITSDPGNQAQYYPIKDVFASNDVLQTSNINRDAFKLLSEFKKNIPNRPVMVTEFQPGWFDAWHAKHHFHYAVDRFDQEISDLLFKINGSVNFYMFIGGTNYGFMNGDRIATSYDYDSPLSEAGNYTAKYYKTRELHNRLVSTGRLPKLFQPEIPPAPVAHAYGVVPIFEELSLEHILEHSLKFRNVHKPVPMEMLNYTDKNNYGQRFGFILYRVESTSVKNYEITGEIRDHGILLVDNVESGVINDGAVRFQHTFTLPHKPTNYKYDLLIENMGRANINEGMNHARKGILSGDIKLDGQVVDNLTIYSLDFNATFMHTISSLKTEWNKFIVRTEASHHSPAMYRAHLTVKQQMPQDTYLQLPGWHKGNVFVNGFNIGRYWEVGPTKTMYIPGPLLKTGLNTIEVFELHKPGNELHFLDHAILE